MFRLTCEQKIVFLFGLISNSTNSSTNIFLISKVSSLQRSNSIFLWNRLQIIIPMVYKRDSSRNIQFSNVATRNTVQILYQGSKRISVSSNQDCLVILDERDNLLLPLNEESIFS